ncbi:MAG: hypothetical protein ACREP2_08180 [Rhodanobacteraceae bacterium]
MLIALAVGTWLNLFNHGDELVRGVMSAHLAGKLVLNYLTPFYRFQHRPAGTSGVLIDEFIAGGKLASMNGALRSHDHSAQPVPLAEHVLRQDRQAMEPSVGLIYELLKSGRNIDLSSEG